MTNLILMAAVMASPGQFAGNTAPPAVAMRQPVYYAAPAYRVAYRPQAVTPRVAYRPQAVAPGAYSNPGYAPAPRAMAPAPMAYPRAVQPMAPQGGYYTMPMMGGCASGNCARR